MATEEGTENNKSLFNTENIVMGILLSGMFWGGNQLITIKEVQATLVTKQTTNDKVNELVYSAVPDIRVGMATILQDQKHMKDDMANVLSIVDYMKTDLSNVKAGTNSLTTNLIMKYGVEHTETGGR